MPLGWAYPVGVGVSRLICKVTGDNTKNEQARVQNFIGSILVGIDPVGGGMLIAQGLSRTFATNTDSSPQVKQVAKAADKVVTTAIATAATLKGVKTGLLD